jgi:hypothetical protein
MQFFNLQGVSSLKAQLVYCSSTKLIKIQFLNEPAHSTYQLFQNRATYSRKTLNKKEAHPVQDKPPKRNNSSPLAQAVLPQRCILLGLVRSSIETPHLIQRLFLFSILKRCKICNSNLRILPLFN